MLEFLKFPTWGPKVQKRPPQQWQRWVETMEWSVKTCECHSDFKSGWVWRRAKWKEGERQRVQMSSSATDPNSRRGPFSESASRVVARPAVNLACMIQLVSTPQLREYYGALCREMCHSDSALQTREASSTRRWHCEKTLGSESGVDLHTVRILLVEIPRWNVGRNVGVE